MIVLDTSAAVELPLNLPLARRVQDKLEDAEWIVHAPHLLTVEILQVLRRRVLAGITLLEDAEEARDLLGDLGIVYHDHVLLAERVWQLRENLTAYDAMYVALAEAVGGELVTTDARLANAPGHEASVALIA